MEDPKPTPDEFHAHCFNDRAEYEKFQLEMRVDGSPVRQFEAAADAISTGDLIALKIVLEQNPALVTMRSVRKHHATLLNYVGANGFEEWRQKTPTNAVEVAETLIHAGAEVDAWGEMYRGTSTLGLVATSVHPVVTGVQEPLMDLLLRHGADVNHAVAPDYTDGLLILACIHNGRGEPIQWLAAHGATVDLEGAGAVGDLANVKTSFDSGSQTKREGCLIWACVYGHADIVHYLLTRGMPVATHWKGTTPLHSAAYGGQLDLVNMLIARGADIEAENEYGGTVLGTTLWSLYNARKPRHAEIMETLIAAGARVREDWWGMIGDIRKLNLTH